MKSKNELKETDIKNRVCYYFNDIINVTKISFRYSLLNKKLHENIVAYKFHIKAQQVQNH